MWWRGDRWSRWSCAPTRGLGSASPRGHAPPAPVVPPNPYQAVIKTYDMGTKNLENYHKGQNPAFDALVTQLMDQTVAIVHGDPDYDAVMLARSRFSEAAHKAGF